MSINVHNVPPLEAHAPETWPRLGQVSADGVAIAGVGSVLFLYGRGYYRSYFRLDERKPADAWARLVSARHRRLKGQCAAFLSLFVPNKLTSMPSRYPLWAPRGGTPAFNHLRRRLEIDSGAIFCDLGEGRDGSGLRHWRLVDSQPSEIGALAITNQVLSRLALPLIEVSAESGPNQVLFGDLSARWGSRHLAEVRSHQLVHDLPAPRLVRDSGGDRPESGQPGRISVWSNPAAKVDAHLLLVGNSVAGNGVNDTHVTWWLARRFSQVTFLHSASVPTDVVGVTTPDVVIMQESERSLHRVPNDELTLAEVTAKFDAVLPGQWSDTLR